MVEILVLENKGSHIRQSVVNRGYGSPIFKGG